MLYSPCLKENQEEIFDTYCYKFLHLFLMNIYCSYNVHHLTESALEIKTNFLNQNIKCHKLISHKAKYLKFRMCSENVFEEIEKQV